MIVEKRDYVFDTEDIFLLVERNLLSRDYCDSIAARLVRELSRYIDVNIMHDFHRASAANDTIVARYSDT